MVRAPKHGDVCFDGCNQSPNRQKTVLRRTVCSDKEITSDEKPELLRFTDSPRPANSDGAVVATGPVKRGSVL